MVILLFLPFRSLSANLAAIPGKGPGVNPALPLPGLCPCPPESILKAAPILLACPPVKLELLLLVAVTPLPIPPKTLLPSSPLLGNTGGEQAIGAGFFLSTAKLVLRCLEIPFAELASGAPE